MMTTAYYSDERVTSQEREAPELAGSLERTLCRVDTPVSDWLDPLAEID